MKTLTNALSKKDVMNVAAILEHLKAAGMQAG